jgi:hypothetical protein
MTDKKKEEKEQKLVMDNRTGLFSFEKDTITVEEHNEEMAKTMQAFAQVLEESLIKERRVCAKIALDLGNDEIAKAIFERVPVSKPTIQ